MLHRCAACIVMLMVALGLASCSDDDPSPGADPSPTVGTTPRESASMTPSATLTSDTSPDLSPEEVVRAWYDAYNKALHSGDTERAEELTTDGCLTCQDELRPIDEVYEAGGSFVGGDWSVVSVKAIKRSGTRVVLSVPIRVAAGRTSARSQAPFEAYDAEAFIVEVTVRRVGGRWRISDFLYLQ